jgi:RNA polymerase sigma-70 factor (ECF subfamily)
MNEMRNGDSGEKTVEERFERAVTDYRERIYLMILKYVRNREDAMDLTQETFIKAYNSLGSFRGESSLYTWIYRIAVNLAINFKSRSRISALQSIDDISGFYSEDSPSESIIRNEISRKIDQSAKKLPEKQRMVFVLRYYEERPYSEISELMGITEGAAKANFHQALKKMKTELKDIAGDGI